MKMMKPFYRHRMMKMKMMKMMKMMMKMMIYDMF